MTEEIKDKVAYVLSQQQFKKHECHWPGCRKQVPPAMWGCSYHWFKLPATLRSLIWRHYQPGQEKTGQPSKAYTDAALLVQAWIKENPQ